MAIEPIVLDRLTSSDVLFNADGTPSLRMMAIWQNQAEQVEESVNAVIDAINAAAAAQAAADAADTAAANAQAAADAADTAAAAATTEQELNNSYVTGITITGTDAGANATINITAHTRVYGDGASVSVNSGSVTGLSYSTLYYIYYDQASRAGGAVTYATTTDETVAVQTGDRHVVGSVTTPAAAAPDESGGYIRPPGVRDIHTL